MVFLLPSKIIKIKQLVTIRRNRIFLIFFFFIVNYFRSSYNNMLVPIKYK